MPMVGRAALEFKPGYDCLETPLCTDHLRYLGTFCFFIRKMKMASFTHWVGARIK